MEENKKDLGNMPKVVLSEEMLSIKTKMAQDTDDKSKNTFIVVRFATPNIPFVSVNKIISTALRLQGFSDNQIFDIMETAAEDETSDRIIKEAKAEFLQKYIKVSFVYPTNVEPSVSEGYVERSLFEKLKAEGRVIQ
jgi:hypothetical protein